MDVKKLIEMAEYCQHAVARIECHSCPGENTEHCGAYMPDAVVAVRDYYKALLKAERAAVIAEVREWANENNQDTDIDNLGWRTVELKALNEKLDSMEPDKGGK